MWAADISPDETNRFNKLPEPIYYQEIHALLESEERGDYYAAYPFDVRPPSDDHPFFFHFLHLGANPGDPGWSGAHLAAFWRQRLPDLAGSARPGDAAQRGAGAPAAACSPAWQGKAPTPYAAAKAGRH